MDNRCVYILKGDRYYIGSTNNIERRIGEHKSKGYSSNRIGERELAKVINCKSRSEARQLEKKIKNGGHPERWI